jgi:glycerol-3-phosphate acyltransferase PlsY
LRAAGAALATAAGFVLPFLPVVALVAAAVWVMVRRRRRRRRRRGAAEAG